MFDKRPHRQICGLCHRLYAIDFHVPNEVWVAAVHVNNLHTIHCLSCFVARADAQLLRWDDAITFTPTSLQTHIDMLGTRTLKSTIDRIAELEAELAESARLHDAGGTREAKLMGQLGTATATIAELQVKITQLEAHRHTALIQRDRAMGELATVKESLTTAEATIKKLRAKGWMATTLDGVEVILRLDTVWITSDSGDIIEVPAMDQFIDRCYSTKAAALAAKGGG